MFKRLIRFLLGKGYEANREEIARQNRLAIHYFALAGIPIALANLAAQSIVRGAPLLGKQSGWLLYYFIALFAFEELILPKRCQHATLIAYAVEAPVMIVSILLGTVWDPSHQAITFLMFMSIMPVFILDRPLRSISITLMWNIVFLIACTAYKDPGIVRGDHLHALEFFLVSIAVTYVVLGLRLEVIQSLERTRYHLEHDAITDIRNMRSLEASIPLYVGRQLFLVMGDIDHFTHFNDFYGNEVGDELLESFAHAMHELFGERHTYREGGDEVLAILEGSEEKGLELLDECRRQLRLQHVDRIHAPVSYSFGYVTGTPANAQEVRSMIQLANIYVHQAKKQGESRTLGGPFSAAALRAGIVESNISTHVDAYDLNQLTGLPTMHYFVTHAEEMMEYIVLVERRPVVGIFNVVGFRSYNSEFGYQKGDELIYALSLMLRDALPQRHIAYFSGSQFGVLCYLDEVGPAMDGVSAALRNFTPGHPIEIRAGFAEIHPGDAVISLLDQARHAHNNVDAASGATWRLYDAELDEEIRLHQYLATHVDEAIQKEWLQVYYQPIVSGEDGRLCDLEALSRWIDPLYGFLAPNRFISALEQEQLTYKLSLHVVRCILRDLKVMQEAGMPLLPTSVNLSRNDFFACDMVEEISRLVEEAGLPPRYLTIEITESAFAENQAFLMKEVERFHERGFSVWMDDFGSEYSTLNLLEKLDFDLVKLDMQFMQDFASGGRNAVIVSAILNMCRQLHMATLVEGVELPEQRTILDGMGCDKLQGYLFSRPLPLPELLSWSRAHL